MDAAEQSAGIAFLSQPATYGVAEVTRIDTHASIVFLAGDRASKIKRAVCYSYLDYATPAAREEFCRAELTLNRRTAPRLHLEVRSVNRDASGRLTFGGPGTIVEWVVVMRRLDQAAMSGNAMATCICATPACSRAGRRCSTASSSAASSLALANATILPICNNASFHHLAGSFG